MRRISRLHTNLYTHNHTHTHTHDTHSNIRWTLVARGGELDLGPRLMPFRPIFADFCWLLRTIRMMLQVSLCCVAFLAPTPSRVLPPLAAHATSRGPTSSLMFVPPVRHTARAKCYSPPAAAPWNVPAPWQPEVASDDGGLHCPPCYRSRFHGHRYNCRLRWLVCTDRRNGQCVVEAACGRWDRSLARRDALRRASAMGLPLLTLHCQAARAGDARTSRGPPRDRLPRPQAATLLWYLLPRVGRALQHPSADLGHLEGSRHRC